MPDSQHPRGTWLDETRLSVCLCKYNILFKRTSGGIIGILGTSLV